MKIIKRKYTKSNLVYAFFFCGLGFLLFSFTTTSKPKKEEMVVITTPYGEMVVRLYPETPLHKANFLKLVRESYYDSTLFHRVIEGFMIQGGDPNSKSAKPGEALGTGGPGYTIPAEFNEAFIHKKGALSAARQGDAVNPKKESSGSQFYIVQGQKINRNDLKMMNAQRGKKPYSEQQIETYESIGGTPHLDGDYTVFGEVIDGLNVIDSIAKQHVDMRSRPKTNIPMTMKIIKRKWPITTKK